ncbi:hypothetical protein GCM10007231_31540 [Nocardioides daphniae]|uniref:GerMN domain-containing protein n=1 Tax=Nocardioides daphniae TaxID=402297 RepID=A0ABQ1QK18_9ACTN|nr:hypothetical protein GCM10007231_31540 [Nocardioides daphniae]
MSSLRHRRRAIAAALAVATLTLAGCGTEQSTTSGETTESTPDATPSPSDDSSEAPAPITVAVPLYYAGDAGGQVRLFREFQQVEGQALTEAARLVDGGEPLDPDYRTLWPGGAVKRAAVTGNLITVTLKGDAFTERPDGMPEAEARLAIQQMVMTLQGVEQSNAPVKFVRPQPESTDGTESDPLPTTLFGVDVTEPVKRAKWINTMSMLNVTVPAQGSAVTGDELVVEGVASSYEANVPWEIRQGDTVVLEGFATADGWMDRLYPWDITINISQLEPGEYTFVARTSDPSEGEGRGPTEDSKDFVVN